MSKSPKDTKGPVVKTGPTKGQNRSRKNDGAWRAKRSDAGKSRSSKGGSSSSKKGCFLTTAACDLRGLPDDCHELTTLRRFRDEILMASPEGQRLIADYYEQAPSLVSQVSRDDEKDRVWSDIQKTVTHIEHGQKEKAIAIYTELFRRLISHRNRELATKRLD